MRRSLLCALAIGAAVSLYGAPVAQAAPATKFTVSGFGDGAGSCGTPSASGTAACTTLRAAITAANAQTNSPMIALGKGTYTLSAGALQISAPLTMQGAGPGGTSGTTIKQTAADRVIDISSFTGTATLINLEITGGKVAGDSAYGGGIYSQSLVELENLLVTGNTATGGSGSAGSGDPGLLGAGGGVYLGSSEAGTSSVIDTTITGNEAIGGAGSTTTSTAGGNAGAAQGGGLYCCSTESLQVTDTTVSHNRVQGGAGGASATHSGDGGYVSGGGVFAIGTVTIRGSTIDHNTAQGGAAGAGAGAPSASGGDGEGGGIDGPEAKLTILNSTIFANAITGGSAPNGAPGVAYAGGLEARGSDASLTLASDTIDANSAQNTGNLRSEVSLGYAVHDTIIAAGKPGNCSYEFNSAAVEGHNLEDDSADSCGFTKANRDLVGVSPELPSALGDNGGATQTLAPSPGSPVLGAGGQCLNPLSGPPEQPLLVDQRGESRPDPCDIGSFEHQSPAPDIAPTISGISAIEQKLTCNRGGWNGDDLSYSYRWLRDGKAIAGAHAVHYLVDSSEAGHRITCAVTASHYGSLTVRTKAVKIAAYALVTKLTGVSGGADAAVRCLGAHGQRCTGKLLLKAGSKTVGTAGYSLAAGHAGTVRISLNAAGHRLLNKLRTLTLKVVAEQRFGKRVIVLPHGL